MMKQCEQSENIAEKDSILQKVPMICSRSARFCCQTSITIAPNARARTSMFNIITAAPNEAVIVSGFRGQRVVIGGCASVFWCVETHDRLYLDLMTLSIKSVEAETAKGVRISLSSTAQIKIMSGDGHKIDYDKVKLAATHFLGKKRAEIQDAVHRTMEGHQRQVIGTLTVEELYKDRAPSASA